MVNNPFITAVIGDFNANLNPWYNSDITTYEDSKIYFVISQIGLQQIMKEPKYIISDFLPCRDLIFTTQPNLVMKYGVYSSLNANCHHHITLAKLNLKVHYPSFYERKAWHYRKANLDQMRRAISEFPWDKKYNI